MLAAEFRDRATSARFLVVSTHLDPLSQRSRVRSVQLIRRVVRDRALPALVMGDLNAGVSSPTVDALLAEGLLKDAWTSAAVRSSGDWGTFANYREPRRGAPRIDWITASPGVQVRRIAVNARRHGGGWGSDHLPVQAEVVIPGYGEAR
jgi:endonuclease/exonuclease/phosphatase family metal-dependent hydrolase